MDLHLKDDYSITKIKLNWIKWNQMKLDRVGYEFYSKDWMLCHIRYRKVDGMLRH